MFRYFREEVPDYSAVYLETFLRYFAVLRILRTAAQIHTRWVIPWDRGIAQVRVLVLFFVTVRRTDGGSPTDQIAYGMAAVRGRIGGGATQSTFHGLGFR